MVVSVSWAQGNDGFAVDVHGTMPGRRENSSSARSGLKNIPIEASHSIRSRVRSKRRAETPLACIPPCRVVSTALEYRHKSIRESLLVVRSHQWPSDVADGLDQWTDLRRHDGQSQRHCLH